jgi:hypothetical protein
MITCTHMPLTALLPKGGWGSFWQAGVGWIPLMKITYEQVRRDDAVAFAAFLADEMWPFHSGGPIDAEAVAREVADGEYNTASVHTHWIVVDGERCGFVKAFDLMRARRCSIFASRRRTAATASVPRRSRG